MDVVWKPLAGSQTLAISCPSDIILLHGTRGGGKTDVQLMRFRRNVGIGYGAFWRGCIFDREYKNLDDIVAKSRRWFNRFGDGARFLSSMSDYKWVWPTGEELMFRSLSRDSDYDKFHGQEFSFIGWNEITKFPTSNLFDDMMSCNRSSFKPEDYPLQDKTVLPDIPLEVVATCNPYGVGMNWVKKRFILPSKSGQILRTTTTVYDPSKEEEVEVTRTQTHIFSSYRENKYLSPKYIADLVSITDPNKKKAWAEGSWDITSGGMFDDLWNTREHVLSPFDIPKGWVVTRSFDYGSSAPFSVGWWTISDGSDVTLKNGKSIATVRGDVFRIAEWFGCGAKDSEGLHMLATEISKGIVERELEMKIYNRVVPGPADTAIYTTMDKTSIATEMTKSVRINGKMYNGVQWVASNKSPGSRIYGWEMLRVYLKNAIRPATKLKNGNLFYLPREKPGLFVFDNCKMFIELFPVMPRDKKKLDDVDTESNDHIGDETRYMILSLVGKSKNFKRIKGLSS